MFLAIIVFGTCSGLINVFLQPCLLKMESFFSLQKGPEEQLARSILYQWMQITYRDLVVRTSENWGKTEFWGCLTFIFALTVMDTTIFWFLLTCTRSKFMHKCLRHHSRNYNSIISLLCSHHGLTLLIFGCSRSNFLGTKFIIYDTQPPYYNAMLSPPGRSRRFSKKVSPKVPSGSYNIAQVTYELNVLGTRGPRRMNCTMYSIPASSLEPNGVVPGQPELLSRPLEDSFRSISFSKSIDHSTEFSSSRFSDIMGTGNEDQEGKVRPLVLKNKSPRWHEQLQCWCLNFRGRVTVASVKNFQLIAAAPPTVAAAPPVGSGPSLSQPTQSSSDHDKIILQFGKVGKDMFTMDYRYPLSAFQAFAICLTSFDTKLACE